MIFCDVFINTNNRGKNIIHFFELSSHLNMGKPTLKRDLTQNGLEKHIHIC